LTIAFGCNKNGSGVGNQSGGGGALLTKVVTIGFNASGAVLDSSMVTISYNSQHAIAQTFQLEIIHAPGKIIIDSITTLYTYGVSLISSAEQTLSTQTIVSGLAPNSLYEQLNTTFNANGGEVTTLVQNGTISSTGINPPENGTVQFEGVLTYNTNSSVSSFTDSSSINGSALNPVFTQTFTYSGNNLSGYILTNTDPLAPGSTSAAYSYNSHLSAAPLYNVIPGLTLPSGNDISELKLVQSGGLYPGQTIYSYTSTYNSLNQPTESSVVVSTTVTNPAYLLLTPTTESIQYYY